MEIEIDTNPSPRDSFFISVPLRKNEFLSFDYTYKGHRVIKQVLVEKKKFPKNTKFDSEWVTIVVKNKKFLKTYKVKWVDMNKLDWVNNEIWETVWVKKISKKLKDRLLKYSQLISDNYKHLEAYRKEMSEFEDLMKLLVKKYDK